MRPINWLSIAGDLAIGESAMLSSWPSITPFTFMPELKQAVAHWFKPVRFSRLILSDANASANIVPVSSTTLMFSLTFAFLGNPFLALTSAAVPPITGVYILFVQIPNPAPYNEFIKH